VAATSDEATSISKPRSHRADVVHEIHVMHAMHAMRVMHVKHWDCHGGQLQLELAVDMRGSVVHTRDSWSRG
jgi:hypothetical protein